MANPNNVFGKTSRQRHYDRLQPAPGTLRIWREMRRVITDLEQRPKRYLYSFAPDHNVDLTLMGSVNVSVIELITFFPNYHMWNTYMTRLSESGWTATKMMKVIRYARDWSLKDGTTRSRIDKHVDAKWKNRVLPCDRTPSVDLSCGAWSTHRHKCNRQLMDYHVEDLACGVRRDRFPQGTDKVL